MDRTTADSLVAIGVPVQLVTQWKVCDWAGFDRWTGLVLLSHDHDGDADILIPALSGPAFYIGALGSRRTHAMRCNSLRAVAVGEADIARVRGPVGLPIGAATPPEIAVSVLAEVIAAWRSGPARPVA